MSGKLRSLVFTSVAHFSNDGNFLMFPVLITYYTEVPGVNIAILGAMAIIYNGISGLLSAPIGILADRLDSDSALMATGIAVNGLAVLIFAVSFLYTQYIYSLIVIGVILLGTGQSFYHPLGATVLSHTFSKRDAPAAMGMNGSLGSAGRALMPSIIVGLVGFLGLTVGLSVISAMTFTFSFAIYLGLMFFKRRNYVKPAKKGEKRSEEEEVLPFSFYTKFLLILASIVFVRSMFLLGTTTFIGDYLDEAFGSKSLMGIVLTLSFLTAIVGQPLFGLITTRKGGKFTIFFSTVFSGVFFLLFLLSGTNILEDTLTYAVFAFMSFSGFPVLLGYVRQVVPNKYSTTSNALVWGVGQTVGGATGIALFTILLDLNLVDTISGMWVMIIFAMISIAMMPMLPSRKKMMEAARNISS